MSSAADTFDSDLLFICKIVISVDFYCVHRAWRGCMSMKPTWVCPAISMPASRNSSKSWLNFPEAAASWLLVPREEWTTSPAEWLSSAAVWFRSVWAAWNVLLQGGSFKDKSITAQCNSHIRNQLCMCSAQLFLCQWKYNI